MLLKENLSRNQISLGVSDPGDKVGTDWEKKKKKQRFLGAQILK